MDGKQADNDSPTASYFRALEELHHLGKRVVLREPRAQYGKDKEGRWIVHTQATSLRVTPPVAREHGYEHLHMQSRERRREQETTRLELLRVIEAGRDTMSRPPPPTVVEEWRAAHAWDHRAWRELKEDAEAGDRLRSWKQALELQKSQQEEVNALLETPNVTSVEAAQYRMLSQRLLQRAAELPVLYSRRLRHPLTLQPASVERPVDSSEPALYSQAL